MGFFNNCIIYPYTTVSSIDDTGQYKETLTKRAAHKVDIQPVTTEIKERVFGEEIKAQKIVFDDVNCLFLGAGEIIEYNNKKYKIEKTVEWDNYSIYAIVEQQ